jgi:hypothetical protein
MNIKISDNIKTSIEEVLESVNFEIEQHISFYGNKPKKIHCYKAWEDYTIQCNKDNIILTFA